MSIDSSMDKVLERRHEVEMQLSRSADLSSKSLAAYSRELSELRPICEQIELVRSLECELRDAMTMVTEAAGDDEMQAMAEAEVILLKTGFPSKRIGYSSCYFRDMMTSEMRFRSACGNGR